MGQMALPKVCIWPRRELEHEAPAVNLTRELLSHVRQHSIQYLLCGRLAAGLERLGVFQVQEQVQVTAMDAKGVD